MVSVYWHVPGAKVCLSYLCCHTMSVLWSRNFFWLNKVRKCFFILKRSVFHLFIFHVCNFLWQTVWVGMSWIRWHTQKSLNSLSIANVSTSSLGIVILSFFPIMYCHVVPFRLSVQISRGCCIYNEACESQRDVMMFPAQDENINISKGQFGNITKCFSIAHHPHHYCICNVH